MIISELIAHLRGIQEIHGDIEITGADGRPFRFVNIVEVNGSRDELVCHERLPDRTPHREPYVPKRERMERHAAEMRAQGFKWRRTRD